MVGFWNNMKMEEFSREIGAEYVEGGFWKQDKVVATVKNWTITFEEKKGGMEGDVYKYTTIRSPYVSKDGFQFKITHKNVFGKLGEFIGIQDAFNELSKYFGFKVVYMKVGHPEFERNFTIKSNNKFKVRTLVENSIIRQLIQSHSDIYLELDKYGLYFSNNYAIDDVAMLKSLYELFKEILNTLSNIESTNETG